MKFERRIESGLTSPGCRGCCLADHRVKRGSWGLICAGGRIAAGSSAFGEQIGRGLVWLGTPRACPAVEVVEDLADEVWIGTHVGTFTGLGEERVTFA